MIHSDAAVEHTVECVCSQENSASLPRCHIQLSLQPDPKSHLRSVFCMSKDKGCILFTRGVVGGGGGRVQARRAVSD